MVLTVSFVLSSVIGLSCHRRPQETCRKLASRELDAGVEASGPHDFAVRSWHHSSLVPPRPSHPRPTFVTIAKRPFVWAGMANDIEVIWVKREPEYFCEEDWTGVSVICPSGALHHVIFVIPGRERSERARKPYSLQGLWIPGPRKVARPQRQALCACAGNDDGNIGGLRLAANPPCKLQRAVFDVGR